MSRVDERRDSASSEIEAFPDHEHPAAEGQDQEQGIPRRDSPHVRYSLTVNTEALSPPRADPQQQLSRSDTEVHRETNISPILRRRTRAATFRTIDDYDELDTSYTSRPGWQPGSEPGYDPQLPDGGHASMPTLSAPCDISVIDFSQAKMVQRRFDNESFVRFIKEPKEPWAKCRWININGLSWDVIQAVGNKKGLHKLALEDLMNIRNRTKCDWYVICVSFTSLSPNWKKQSILTKLLINL